MLPLIGLTTYGRNATDQFHLYANYLEAVCLAGGIPAPSWVACWLDQRIGAIQRFRDLLVQQQSLASTLTDER